MSTKNFIRHYIEMVIAMVAGMAILGIPAAAGLSALGTSMAELHTGAPAAMLIGMAFTMTIPMVAWMRFRGHGWPASLEMASSMFIPTFATVGLLAAGIITDIGVLMTIQHVVMLPAMLVAMLIRRDEYGAVHHAQGGLAPSPSVAVRSALAEER